MLLTATQSCTGGSINWKTGASKSIAEIELRGRVCGLAELCHRSTSGYQIVIITLDRELTPDSKYRVYSHQTHIHYVHNDRVNDCHALRTVLYPNSALRTLYLAITDCSH